MSADGRLLSRPGTTGSTAGPGLHALRAGAVLLVPDGAPAPAPLLVFLHGAGGNGAGSLHHVRSAAEAAGVLVLAPSSQGSTWDLLTGRLGPDVAALDDALAQVFSLHDVGRVALSGFSDGGSYALSLGLANGDLLTDVIAFSPGFLAPPAQVGVPRVWVSHGTADRVLPVERCGRQVVRTLTGAGYDVTYEEFAGGHVVPTELVTAALAWWLG
jgi:phospholipase/carboxylesterase